MIESFETPTFLDALIMVADAQPAPFDLRIIDNTYVLKDAIDDPEVKVVALLWHPTIPRRDAKPDYWLGKIPEVGVPIDTSEVVAFWLVQPDQAFLIVEKPYGPILEEFGQVTRGNKLEITGPTHCADCGMHTSAKGEWYLLRNEIWEQAWPGTASDQVGEGHFLCIGCVEARLGRKLTRADFDHPERWPSWRLSKRLQDRLR
jgi:hypothetical protein